MKKVFKGFTLIELIAVVVIVGILAAIAYPQYQKTKERALGREARANMELILAALKIYRMQNGEYYPASGTIDDINTINSVLKLSLNEEEWDYTLFACGSPDRPCARASRKNGPYSISTGSPCRYSIGHNPDRVVKGTFCP